MKVNTSRIKSDWVWRSTFQELKLLSTKANISWIKNYWVWRCVSIFGFAVIPDETLFFSFYGKRRIQSNETNPVYGQENHKINFPVHRRDSSCFTVKASRLWTGSAPQGLSSFLLELMQSDWIHMHVILLLVNHDLGCQRPLTNPLR